MEGHLRNISDKFYWYQSSGFLYRYEGESISNQPNLFPVEIHLFFLDVIAL